MPILAPLLEVIPPVDPGFGADLSRVDSRRLAFRALDGSYPFEFAERDEFFFQPDIEGIDIPPREIVSHQVPFMDGERLDEIRTLKREVYLPLLVSSRLGHEYHLRRRDDLARLFNYRTTDYRRQEGTLDLVATSLRGERSLRCTYVDGMAGGMWPGEGSYWAKLGIKLLAVQPYWRGPQWSTPTITIAQQEEWFGTWPGGFTTDRAIGDGILVTVDGDTDSHAIVDLAGPATSVFIEGDGLSISIPGGLLDGETAHIVTNPRGRTAQFSGVKQWDRVAPGDLYRPLKPGDQFIDIRMVGATSNSSAVVYGDTLWERPW